MKIPRLPFFRHRFALTGLNLERFINTMQKSGVPLLRVSRQDGRTLLCECHSSDLAAIAAMADEKGWRMHEIQPLALSALWVGMKKRPGIPIGLALALAAVMVLSQFVWRVEVHHAGAYEADIAGFLKQSGYGMGVPRQSVDAEALERALTYRYPDVAWFHVYVSNVTLVVDVTHGVSMPVLPDENQSDIVAAQGGVVDSLRVFAGAAAVKPGDVVQKGQVLIRGEERGADGEIIPVRAEGVVTARCWLSRTVNMPIREITSTETGRQVSQMRIRTPWIAFPARWESPAFLAYNTYVEETPIVGSFFPVVCQTITHREVEMEYTQRDVETVRQEASEAALNQLKDALYGYEIIDKWVDYCMIEDESLSATATAEWLMDIGEPSSP